MLNQLIHCIEIGLISYLRQAEGENYHGPSKPCHEFLHLLSTYLKAKSQLPAARKSHILDVLLRCEIALQQSDTPKEFVRQLLIYIMPLRSYFERWCHKHSRLQLAIIHAIEQYSLELITQVDDQFMVNEHAKDDPVDLFQLTTVFAAPNQEQGLSASENMATSLLELKQQLSEQASQLRGLTMELAAERAKHQQLLMVNHELSNTVCELKTLILLQQYHPTAGAAEHVTYHPAADKSAAFLPARQTFIDIPDSQRGFLYRS